MPLTAFNNPTLEQTFLAKYCIENARCADRGLRGIFRITTELSAPSVAGFFSTLGSSSFSLPTVERAPAKMEISSTGAAHGSLGPGLGRRTEAPTPPIFRSTASTMQHEVLQVFFEALLNSKDRTANVST